MAEPAIAVEPVGTPDWIRHAVGEGGGRLVDLNEANGLIWTAGQDHEGLREALKEATNVRWIQLPWAGVEAFTDAGIFDSAHIWTSGKGVYARPVAEHALALGLAGLRNLTRFAAARSWGEQSGISLVGGRVTIFGAGGITTELLRLLAPFGCTTTVVRRHPREMEGVDRVLGFDRRFEALRDADLVILALALTEETVGLISAVELELMAPHAWLVNIARGRHVVTEDLLSSLREDAIGGAALDVTDPEPLPEGHPLWSLPNCLITPHTANTEDMAMPLLTARIAENVRRFAADEPLIGMVDSQLGY